ncbi:MAG: PD-(D/E)XK nuclease family protein [Thermodesulfobacteriota bacterium]
MDSARPPLSRLFAGPYSALERVLLSRLADPAWGGPGWERVLLVPSNDLREHLMKRLASVREGAAAGASAMTLYDFALRLLAHRGMFPRELPPARMSAAVTAGALEAYASGEGDFARIAGTPGFPAALAGTLGDLEEGWIGDAELASASRAARERGDTRAAERWAEWRRLSAAVARKVRAMGGETRRKIFQEAVAGFEQPGYPFRVILYGFYDFTRLQWTLVDRLLSSGLLDEVYFPGLFGADGALSPSFLFAARSWDRLRTAFEGNVDFLEDAPEPPVAAVRERIFSSLPPASPVPVPFPVLSAPHGEGEMRLAARRVRRWLDEAPGDTAFLVARKTTPEAMADWERIAREYGIVTAGRIDVPLSSVPPVRLLLRMIEAARDDYPRRKVIDVLASPYRRMAAEDGPVPPRPDLWDILSRERQVFSGNDWETRLSRRPRGRRRDEEEDAEGRAAQVELLAAEVRALRRSLSPLSEATGYASLARALREILAREFRVLFDDGPESERDRRAVEELFGMLADLEGIPDALLPWPGTRLALGWIAGLFADRRLFTGERGGMRIPGAVVFGDSFAMRGVTADRALMLSIDEGSFPAQLEEDPLLPDAERAELNRLTAQAGLPDALSLRRRNAAEEKLLFALPAASVRKGIAYSVRRADSSGAAGRPSRYLLHLMSRFAGPSVFSEEWERVEGADVERLPRSPSAALAGDGPRSAREKALAAWLAGGIAPATGVRWSRILGVLEAWAARSRGEYVYPGPAVPVAPPETHSASALEELARCPYRYFLRYLLRFDPPEEPEEAASLTWAEMGEIAHDALRILGKDAAEGKGWGDGAAAARKAAARFSRENPAGLPGLFRIQCLGIAADVERLAERERLAAGERPGWRVETVEKSFTVPPSALPGFRGRVDRLDRGPAGEARVVDYKYSDPKRAEVNLEWLLHGLSHQLPVYLAWARSLDPAPPSVSAVLYFLRGGLAAAEAPPWEAFGERWAAALADWLSLARAGVFPPLPHHRYTYAQRPAPRYCEACPFKDHCRVSPEYDGSETGTDALAAAISRDPALSVLADHRPEKG